MRAAVAGVAHGTPIEVWFQDEARVGQQGTLTRVWAKRGTRPRAVRDRRYTWAWLLARSAPSAAWAPPWCCRTSTLRP